MTSTMGTGPQRERVVTRHPVRGAIWGLLLGLSIAIYMVLFRVIAFGEWLPLGLCVLGGVAIGVVWAYVAPPKQRADEELDGLDDDLAITATTAAATTAMSDAATDDTPRSVPSAPVADGGGEGDGGDGGDGDGD